MAQKRAGVLPPGPVLGPVHWIQIIRRPLRSLGWRRAIKGGNVADLGRLPRYFALFLIGATLIWAPILGYLASTPVRYTSFSSLILPGSGVSASVNLNNIGQASSFANSAFSNGSISPTETYKRLISADRILEAAAERLGIPRRAFGKPRINLVDQTSLIHVEVTGSSPKAARAQGDALLAAFFAEIDALREDEIATRGQSGEGAIAEYTRAVSETRAEIEAIQAASGLVSVEQYRQHVEANDNLTRDLRGLESALGEQREKVMSLQLALDLSAARAAATLKLYADAQYLELLDMVAAQSTAFSQAKAKFGARHPSRIAAQAAYDGARRAALGRASAVTGLPDAAMSGLDRAPAGERAALLSELVREDAVQSGMQARVDALRGQIVAESARLAKLAPVAAELEDRQRDFAVAEAVFASAIARAESKKTDVYASYPLVQVLENPSLPDAPSSPRRKLSILAGGAGTFMVLIALFLAWIRRPLIEKLMAQPSESAKEP